jgi:hypothetical protein
MAPFGEGFCFGCNTYSNRLVDHLHHYSAGAHMLWLCPTCITKPQDLCNQNMTGVHGEIIDACEDPTYVYPRSDDTLDSQLGYCVLCREPFFWSVDRQRWVKMEWENATKD